MLFSNFTSPVSPVLSQIGISVKDLIAVLFRVTLAGSRRLRPEQNTNRHFSGLGACRLYSTRFYRFPSRFSN